MAKTTYKIQVEFLNGTTGEYGNKEGTSVASSEVIKEPKTASSQTSNASKAVGVALLSSGKAVVKYGATAYGDFTGDYVAQNSISRGLDVVNIGIETAGYVAILGPIGFAVEGIKLGTESIIKMAQNYVFLRNQKISNLIQTERRGILLSKGGR